MADDIDVVSVQKQRDELHNWLVGIYDSSQDGDDRGVEVYDRMDDLLLDHDFDTVDLIFEILSEDFLSEATDQLGISLCFLMVSHGGQDRLPSRRIFYEELATFVEHHTEHEVSAMFGDLG